MTHSVIIEDMMIVTLEELVLYIVSRSLCNAHGPFNEDG